MSKLNNGFAQALSGLWLRLSTIFCTALLLAFALLTFPGKAFGWLYYLSGWETAYELLVRTVALFALGALLAMLCTIVAAPVLYPIARRKRAADATAAMASVAAIFFDLFVAVVVMGDWAHLSRTARRAAFAGLLVGFAVWLLKSGWRREVERRFEAAIPPRAMRFAMAAALLVVALLAASGRTAPASAQTAPSGSHPKPNILLVTFDAMAAYDMQVYGYKLPTTPHIAEFAQTGTVFDNFYSASTFTTPSLASMLTGLEPSETGVYHLPGRLRGERASETLPRVLRDSGYATAALISSSYAYFFASWQARDFDILRDGPLYSTPGAEAIWEATPFLHPAQPFGSRLDEFRDLETGLEFIPVELNSYFPKWFTHSTSDLPPDVTFARARKLVDELPDGFFLWVHVMAPHSPYLPRTNLGRFLPGPEMRTFEDQSSVSNGHTYTPDEQELVDQDRLRYDEFIADTDAAFGDFIAGVRADGKLANTAVIVSADHGESFQGGIFKHESPYQTPSEIHIPLIIHVPGQKESRRVPFVADQTALAPTILEIAGLPRASWMKGESLTPWIGDSAAPAGAGLAFTEYLETDSIFRPLTSGTAGVTDGIHQYVYNLATHKGALRDATDPRLWYVDHSSEDPEDAQRLSEALKGRFPQLIAK